MMKSILESFDFYFTMGNLITYIFYFLIIFCCSKNLRRISYFQMHHVNFIGLMIALLSVVWSIEMYPFQKNKMPSYACYIFEILWACLKYIRVYAVLTLAVYRYIAVFRLSLFQKIKKSFKYTLFSAILAWLIPIIWFLLIKYSTGTIGSLYCIDGYNSNIKLSILYYTLTLILGFLLPTIFIIYLSVIIHLKIFKSVKKVKSAIKSICFNNTKNNKFKKEHIFIIQLYLLNSIEIIIFLFMLILYIASLVPGMFNQLEFQIMNVVPIFLSACIPIITISSFFINNRQKN